MYITPKENIFNLCFVKIPEANNRDKKLGFPTY